MLDTPLSRRGFLRFLGAACALSGLGAGLGGILSACNDDDLASNTTATIAPLQSTTTTEATSTTATTGPELGRPVRIGLVSAQSGSEATFGKADTWWTEYAGRALPDGLISGDGKARKIEILTEDNRSDAKAASRAAVSLISEARVDILLCSGTPALVDAAAAQAESLECPCIADFVPWRSFVFDRGGSAAKPFRWTYAHAFGVDDMAGDFLQMWDQVPTNKTVGLVFADDTYGQIWSGGDTGIPSVAGVAGYKCVLPPPYTIGAADFTAQLADLVENGCEICCGAMNTEDLITFWTQAHDQEYMPKIATMADALLFPQALDALGQSGLRMTTGGLWLREWPFRDSITGKTAMELAQDYMDHTGEQWTAAIGQYAKFEWAVDVFRRMADILDNNDVIARVRTTRLQTCAGLIDFTAPVGSPSMASSRHPVENVYKAPVCGMQWVEGLTFSFEPRLAGNRSDPELKLDGTIDPMEYS
jgi:branched-chain amino acid transport system substrate-binding protein